MSDPTLEIIKRLTELEAQVAKLKAQLIIPNVVRTATTPTTGYHKQGEIVWSLAPVSRGVIGAVCIASGTPGTWALWGQIQ